MRQNRSFLGGAVGIGTFLVICGVVGPGPAAGEDAPESQESDRRLQQMRRRAEATKVYAMNREDGEDRRLARPVPRPAFRYSDQPRDIRDATLWCYGRKGRPMALQKVENYRRPADQAQWLYCMTSLRDGLIEARWQDDRQWSSKEAGIELRTLPEGPKPAPNRNLRLLQMKRLVRRFSAEIYDTPTDVRETMRLLARPIYRYNDKKSGLRDGMIFGFATNGTNPDLLVLIELHDSGEKLTWKYGLARMTIGELTVRLDGKQVWKVPYIETFKKVTKFDTWLFFWETPGEAAE